MRKRAKVDGTHGEVVEAFRAGGWSVLSLASLGNGAPDLLVENNLAEMFLIEVKSANGKLRSAQEQFQRRFTVYVVRSAAEAIEFMTKEREL